MKPQDRLRLLEFILSSQLEGRAGAVIPEERMRQALSEGPSFTNEEKRILWLSPDSRELFLSVRKEIREELSQAVRMAGYGQAKRVLAASAIGSEEQIIGNGWTLWIYHDDIPGAEWALSLRLDQDYLKLLPKQTVVALRDRGGKTWLSGVPDFNQQLDAVWVDMSETPYDRMQKFELVVDP